MKHQINFLCLVIIIFILIRYNLSSCELCGCSNSLNYNINLTNQNKNLIGIRYLERSFETKHLKLFENSKQITSNEYYHTIDILGRIILNQDFQLNFNLPYNFLHQKEEGNITNVNGIGDVTLSLGYNLINDINVIEDDYTHRLQLNLGVKLPTGKNESFGINDIARPNFTLGTGSLDFPISAAYIAAYKKFGFINESIYSINTENSNKYIYGNRLGNSTRVFYKFNISNLFKDNNNDKTSTNFIFSESESIKLLIPSLSLTHEYSSFDLLNGVKQEYTGGNITYISLGVDLLIDNLNIGLWYFEPINQNLGKGNITNLSRVQFSTIYSL